MLVILSVVVTPMRYQNMKNVLVCDTTTLPCRSSPTTSIVWYFEQFCDNFEHGLYFCSNPSEIDIGQQYQIHADAPGEHSLWIRDVTKNMTGLYSCRMRDNHTVIYRMLLGVICEYNFVLLLLIHPSGVLLGSRRPCFITIIVIELI